MQLDYAILADAAISKGDGLMHLIGGGISNFNVPAIPAPISASLAIDEDGNPMLKSKRWTCQYHRTQMSFSPKARI
jgi:hypothetical protein